MYGPGPCKTLSRPVAISASQKKPSSSVRSPQARLPSVRAAVGAAGGGDARHIGGGGGAATCGALGGRKTCGAFGGASEGWTGGDKAGHEAPYVTEKPQLRVAKEEKNVTPASPKAADSALSTAASQKHCASLMAARRRQQLCTEPAAFKLQSELKPAKTSPW